jgi:hypothetical protein
MDTLGIILAVVGGFALLYGLYRKSLVDQVLASPLVSTGDAATKGAQVAGERNRIAVAGDPTSARTLTAPVTGTECLYFEYEIKQCWKEDVWDDKENKYKKESKEAVLASDKHGVNFKLDDGSGAVQIEAEDGGLFDLETTFKESKGNGKLFQGFSEYQEGQGNSFKLGNFKIEKIKDAPEDSVFKVVEKVLKPGQRLFVAGRLNEDGAIGEQGRTRLIVSPRSREKYLADTARWTRELLWSGLGVPVGIVMYNWIDGLIVIAVAAALYPVIRKYREPIVNAWDNTLDRIHGWMRRAEKAMA